MKWFIMLNRTFRTLKYQKIPFLTLPTIPKTDHDACRTKTSVPELSIKFAAQV